MERRRIVIVGGGGHARVVADVIDSTGAYEVAGYTSLREEDGIPGHQRLGDDGMLAQLRGRGIHAAFVALGDNALRARVYGAVAALGFELPSVVHPSAIISSRARLGSGTVAMPGAVVNTGTRVGDGAILNTGATIDHDCRIGNFAHVAPGCHLAGTVCVGEGAFLGTGTSVIPMRRIGAWALIGAGAAVVADVEAGAHVAGVPARPIGSAAEASRQ